MDWQYPFFFHGQGEPDLSGRLALASPQYYGPTSEGPPALRKGELALENGKRLEVVLYHNPSTEAFFYLSEVPLTGQLRKMLNLPADTPGEQSNIRLPGQLVLGSRRTRLVHQAMRSIFSTASWEKLVTTAELDELVVFPIVREGVKFGIAEAISDRYNWIVEEILVDAHHVYDKDVPGYGRRTRIAVFKDNDLNKAQRRTMKTAIVGDSIASGTVLISVIDALKERYAGLERIEVIAPFAALRGLARIGYHISNRVSVRVHAFETLLNTLPPDYYWSAHFPQPEFHFDAQLEQEYRTWWGQDEEGQWLADTACAGYGWSEAFFNPGKHLRMINGQLEERHGLSMSQVIQRSMAFAG